MSMAELRKAVETEVTLPGSWEEYEVYEDLGCGGKRKCELRF
jgi:hypothetical protein